ncbi:MAG: LemA family protein [archaeon]
MAKGKSLGTGSIVLIVIAIIAVVMLLWLVSVYNGLVTLDETVNNKWAQVETVYQRRADLIPNLVETVKGAAEFESGTQTRIAELRTQAAAAKKAWDTAGSVDEKVAAANQLEQVATGFRGLNINVENYPQLKATANFQALQDELANTENKVAVERKRYNDAVTALNAKLRRFPTNIIAGMFGFDQRTYFEAQEGAESAPSVKFV